MDYASQLKKYVNVLVHEGGSDLHFSVGAHPTIRVAGSLSPMLKEPVLTPEDALGFVKVLVSPEQEKRFLSEQEVDFAYESEDKVRFRGNAFFQRGSAAVALRLIPKAIRSVQELNLPDVLTTFEELTGRTRRGREQPEGDQGEHAPAQFSGRTPLPLGRKPRRSSSLRGWERPPARRLS